MEGHRYQPCSGFPTKSTRWAHRRGEESPDSDTSTALAEDAAVPPLSQGERRELSEANERLSTICAEASKANLSLLFDAEQTPRSPPTAANHRSFC